MTSSSSPDRSSRRRSRRSPPRIFPHPASSSSSSSSSSSLSALLPLLLLILRRSEPGSAAASASASASAATPPPPRHPSASAATPSAALSSPAASSSSPAAVSRAYPLGCSDRPPSFYDYESAGRHPLLGRLDPEGLVRRSDDFALLRRLGAGKFSDVFEAVDLGGGTAAEVATERRPEGGKDDPPLVVIKCLKPVSERKVRRELLVLSHASSLPNLARLRGVVIPGEEEEEGEDECDSDGTRGGADRRQRCMPSLILEHAGPDARWLCHGPGLDAAARSGGGTSGAGTGTGTASSEYHLSEYETKYYLLHLLAALDALHSRGIMHRDVKPRNVLINRSHTRPPPASRRGEDADPDPDPDPTDRPGGTNGGGERWGAAAISSDPGPLMLIDLGLADFYRPGTLYNVRVASRHYKSPELLVGNESYDYSVDLWGVGCILAGLLLRREPFFRGKDNPDQLGRIAAVLGTRDLAAYCDGCGVALDEECRAALRRHAGRGAGTAGGSDGEGRRPWLSMLPRGCPVPSPQGLDLLDRLMVYDHRVRLTAREAMTHPFFDEVRQRVNKEIQLQGLNQNGTRDRHALFGEERDAVGGSMRNRPQLNAKRGGAQDYSHGGDC